MWEMWEKLRQRLTTPHPLLSQRTWVFIYLSSLVLHLILLLSLGHIQWKIRWEKWSNLRPATQKVALTVQEQEPPPPPRQEKPQGETKDVAKSRPKPTRQKARPSSSPSVPKEVPRIQSVNELMEPYELARDTHDEEASASDGLEDFVAPTPVKRTAPVPETLKDRLDDLDTSKARERTNPEGSEDGLPGGFEGFQGSFSSYLGLLRRAGLDVVFVIDSTGSMGWIIEQVKTKITSMMDVIRKLVPTARLGLVGYRDRGEEYLTRLHPLTFQVDKLLEFLVNLEAKEGGDWEEAVEEGVKTAVEGMQWRKNAKKVIIIVGDAPPHKKDMDKALNLVDQFRSQGGFVSTIDARHESNDDTFSSFDTANVLKEFVQIATRGHGEHTSLGRQKKIIQQLVILTFGSRWEEVMAEYVEGL